MPPYLMFFFFLFFFFFNDTATTEIYTLSLHDALPISRRESGWRPRGHPARRSISRSRDRKSTRLNSSHWRISYAVFCLKKKKERSCCNSRQWIDESLTLHHCVCTRA